MGLRPIYYSAHMYGLFSIYNPDALKDLTIYKGGIPANYGGRASSILDLATKNGNNQRFGISGGIGTMTTRLSLQGPIIKNRLSFFASGRSSKYSIGQLFEGFEESVSEQNKGKRANPYFHDINAKINYHINDNNSVYVSGYFGEDGEGEGSRKWGNTAGSLRWNHVFNPKLFSNTSLTFSDYNYYESGGGIGFTYEYDAGIKSAGFKQDFTWFLNPNNTLKLGVETTRYDFTHGDVTLSTTERDDGGKFMEPMQGLESAVSISNEQKLGALLSANYGLRYSLFNRMGPGNEVTYDEDNSPLTSEPFGDWETMSIHGVLEPRIAVTYLLNDISSLKLSYNRMAQYIRLMNLGMIRNAYDVWMPTTNNIEPIIVDQVAAGYFKNFADNTIEFSAEAYYKSYQNQSDFEDGLHNYFVNNLEAFVATGIGRGYGLEFSLRKKYGRLTGWMNYNLSKSENKIEEINHNRWYPNVYDQMYNFTSVIMRSLFHLKKAVPKVERVVQTVSVCKLMEQAILAFCPR